MLYLKKRADIMIEDSLFYIKDMYRKINLEKIKQPPPNYKTFKVRSKEKEVKKE